MPASTVRYCIFSFLFLTLAAAWTWFSRVPDASSANRIPSPREGFPAPDFTLNTFDGQAVSLSSFRGQVVIVNLWASWCAPCRAEMPAIQKLYQVNRNRGLVVLGVNSTIRDSVASARKFVDEVGVTFTILLDSTGSVSRRYLLRALPSTFIIDRQGVIRSVIIGGPVSEAVLQSKIEPRLNDTP